MPSKVKHHAPTMLDVCTAIQHLLEERSVRARVSVVPCAGVGPVVVLAIVAQVYTLSGRKVGTPEVDGYRWPNRRYGTLEATMLAALYDLEVALEELQKQFQMNWIDEPEPERS